MLGVGFVAALSGLHPRRDAPAMPWWALPSAFLATMAIGGVLVITGVAFPGVEPAILGSVILLGLAVIAASSIATPLLLTLVAAAGLAHGNAHGTEVPSAANPLLYALGFLAVTAALHATGILGGVVLRRTSSLRIVVGATIAATGMLLLG